MIEVIIPIIVVVVVRGNSIFPCCYAVLCSVDSLLFNKQIVPVLEALQLLLLFVVSFKHSVRTAQKTPISTSFLFKI
jgi:hypothetical protein